MKFFNKIDFFGRKFFLINVVYSMLIFLFVNFGYIFIIFCTLFVQNSLKNFLSVIRVLVFLSQKIHKYFCILFIIDASITNCFCHCLESNKLKKNWAAFRFCLRFAAKLLSIFFSWARHFPSKSFCKTFSHKKIFLFCFVSPSFRRWEPLRSWAPNGWRSCCRGGGDISISAYA